MNYPLAAEPLQLAGVALKNRIVRASHGTGMTSGGRITDDLVAFHAERARGGASLTILEAAGVHPTWVGEIDASTDEIIGDFQRLVASTRPHDMKLFQQLWLGPGPNGIWFNGGSSPLSASSIPVPISGYMPQPLTLDQIDEMVDAMAAAARRCIEGGIDGIEIHSGHGYLLGSFLSPITNRRTDDYGGSEQNRTRFLRRILNAVRSEIGTEVPLGVRVSADEGVAGGLGSEDVARILRSVVDECPIDFLNVSNGTQFKVDQVFASAIAPHMYEMPASSVVSNAVDVPAIVTGRFMSLAEAETVLASGDAQMVSMVRALIADPHLPNKSFAGAEEQVRPCIGCNQGCLGGVRGPLAHLFCAVNPEAGRESQLGTDHLGITDEAKRVVVVGGGPAGCEAARSAAERGHLVTLFEQSSQLGGQLRLAAKSPNRSDTATVIGFWESELERLGVDVRLDTKFDSSTHLPDCDEVIVAVGSEPRLDGVQLWSPATPVTGWGSLPASSSWDVLEGASRSGTHVVVYDDNGHYEAIDVASRLVADGANVDFITPFFTFGTRVEATEKGWEDRIRPHLRRLVNQPNFRIHGNVRMTSIDGSGVSIASADSGAETRLQADEIVAITANKPVQAPAIDRAGVTVHTVGDAAGVRTLEAAVWDGHECGARAIGGQPSQRAD